MDDPENNCWQEEGIFLFFRASTTVQGPIKPPIQQLLEVLSLEAKQWREADHSLPSRAEVKKEWR